MNSSYKLVMLIIEDNIKVYTLPQAHRQSPSLSILYYNKKKVAYNLYKINQ